MKANHIAHMTIKKKLGMAAAIMAVVPLFAVAQTTSQEELIKMLQQNKAALQAELEKLRSGVPPHKTELERQITANSSEFAEKLREALKQSTTSPASRQNPEVKLKELLNRAQTPAQIPSPSNNSTVQKIKELLNKPQNTSESGGHGFTFNRDLYFGMRNNPDVSNLQEFLIDQGFYNNTISGNYFILTQSAVKKFQAANGLKATGYFGTLSRAIANKMLATYQTGEEEDGDGTAATPGKLYLMPENLRLNVGESAVLQAQLQHACPAGTACTQALQDVRATFTSNNTAVAIIEKVPEFDCAPPRMCPLALDSYQVRAKAHGTAIITATYADTSRSMLTATAHVAVSATTTTP